MSSDSLAKVSLTEQLALYGIAVQRRGRGRGREPGRRVWRWRAGGRCCHSESARGRVCKGEQGSYDTAGRLKQLGAQRNNSSECSNKCWLNEGGKTERKHERRHTSYEKQDGRLVSFEVKACLCSPAGCAGLAAIHAAAEAAARIAGTLRWHASMRGAQSFLMTFSTMKKPASVRGPMAQNTPVRAISHPGVESMGMICRPGQSSRQGAAVRGAG